MASVISRQSSTQIVESITSTSREASNTLNVGRPSEQLEIDDAPRSTDEVVYPTGPKLYLALAALYTAAFLNGLVMLHTKILLYKIDNSRISRSWLWLSHG